MTFFGDQHVEASLSFMDIKVQGEGESKHIGFLYSLLLRTFRINFKLALV